MKWEEKKSPFSIWASRWDEVEKSMHVLSKSHLFMLVSEVFHLKLSDKYLSGQYYHSVHIEQEYMQSRRGRPPW